MYPIGFNIDIHNYMNFIRYPKISYNFGDMISFVEVESILQPNIRSDYFIHNSEKNGHYLYIIQDPDGWLENVYNR